LISYIADKVMRYRAKENGQDGSKRERHQGEDPARASTNEEESIA